jgi:hypothetical protein
MPLNRAGVRGSQAFSASAASRLGDRIWLAEFESARQDRRAVTYTMHPEAIGRGPVAVASELARVTTAQVFYFCVPDLAATPNATASSAPRFKRREATTCDILPVSLQKRSLLRHHGPDRR